MRFENTNSFNKKRQKHNSKLPEDIKKAWDHTNLSRAWEHEVQVEAVSRVSEIFDNFVASRIVVPSEPTEGPHDSSDAPDADAGWEGVPFMSDDTTPRRTTAPSRAYLWTSSSVKHASMAPRVAKQALGWTMHKGGAEPMLRASRWRIL